MNNDFYKLMLITQLEDTPLPQYLEFIKICISSGVTCVQLREKKANFLFKLNFARQLKQILDAHEIPLIINDDVHLAKQIDAQGIHLGQSDGPPEIAKKELGNNKWIGLSIETEQELIQANSLPLNYVAASAVFPSSNKDNIKTIWGIDGFKKLCKQSQHPLIGIGGINENNLPELIEIGAQGVAIIGALHQAKNPAETALKLRKIIDHRN